MEIRKKNNNNIRTFISLNIIMTLTCHGPHFRECEATDPHSCLHQGIPTPTYLTGITNLGK